MLRKVIRPDKKEVCFEYDALGRRTAKIFKSKITRWVWDGNKPLHEWSYDVNERPKTIINEFGLLSKDKAEPIENLITWVFDEGTLIPAAKLQDGESYSIITDYLGTPAEAYDSKGEKIWECELTSSGKIRKITGLSSFIPFRYQGQYEDEETGLYYNRFRYYAPEEGVYITQDPIGLAGNNPTFYGYVKDSNTRVDIFGLNECTKYGPNDGGKLEDDIEQALRDNGIDFTRGRKVGIKGEIDFETSTHIIEATVSNGGKLKQIKKYKTEEFNPEGKEIILVGPNYMNKAAIRDIQNEGAQVVHSIDDMLGLM